MYRTYSKPRKKQKQNINKKIGDDARSTPPARPPLSVALAPPHPPYPKHGRERHKAKEDVQPGGQRFSTDRKGHPK